MQFKQLFALRQLVVSTDGHVSFVFSQLLLKSLQFLSLKNKTQVKKKI